MIGMWALSGLLGIGLGCRFRAGSLVMMTGLLAVLFLGFNMANGVSLWTGVFRTFVAIGCLQAGYLLGLCISTIWRRSSQKPRQD